MTNEQTIRENWEQYWADEHGYHDGTVAHHDCPICYPEIRDRSYADFYCWYRCGARCRGFCRD